MMPAGAFSPVTVVTYCPGCSGTDAKPVGEPAAGFVSAVRGHDYWQPPYSALRCPECGLVYKSHTASAESLTDYYSKVDFGKWVIPGLFPNERAVLDRLRQLPAGGRILDIGCSTGRLLSRLSTTYRCYGAEINPAAAAQAAAAGLTMLDPFGWTAPDSALAFDAVVAVDVFEHLSAPTDFLVAAAGRLAPGGQLILCTGNADAAAVAGDPANFWYFRNVEHLVMLTRQYADFAATRTGLRVISWAILSHYDSTLAARLRQWVQAIVFETLHRGRYRPLGPLLRLLPAGRKAARWATRPTRNLTADHLVVVFEKAYP